MKAAYILLVVCFSVAAGDSLDSFVRSLVDLMERESVPVHKDCPDCAKIFTEGIRMVKIKFGVSVAGEVKDFKEKYCTTMFIESLEAELSLLQVSLQYCDDIYQELYAEYRAQIMGLVYTICGPKEGSGEVTPPPGPDYGFCTQYGNVYTPVDNCRAFDQRVGTKKPVDPKPVHRCPDGLLFDTKLCVCNYAYKVTCGKYVETTSYRPPTTRSTTIYRTTTTTYRPPTTTPYRPPQTSARPYDDEGTPTGYGYCTRRGNVYTAVENCKAFDQRPGTKPPQYPEATHRCPANTLFDVDLCVCNHDYAVTCGGKSGGGGGGPVSADAVYPKPASYDGFCVARGNVYTPVDGCRYFDQRPGSSRPSNPERTHMCPSDTLFDVTLCVCNWPDKVSCPV